MPLQLAFIAFNMTILSVEKPFQAVFSFGFCQALISVLNALNETRKPKAAEAVRLCLVQLPSVTDREISSER